MEAEWNHVDFHMKPEDQSTTLNKWGFAVPSWEGFKVRVEEAVSFCEGPMIHGRWCLYQRYSSAARFHFKSKKDAMTFKLARGG